MNLNKVWQKLQIWWYQLNRMISLKQHGLPTSRSCLRCNFRGRPPWGGTSLPTLDNKVLLQIKNLKHTFANCLLFQVPCDNSSTVPIMHWHGTLDPLFPWLVPVQCPIRWWYCWWWRQSNNKALLSLNQLPLRYGGVYHSVPYTMAVWRENNRYEICMWSFYVDKSQIRKQ